MILASASPRRKELLESQGLELVVCPADVDEQPYVGESPTELVARLARDKAYAAYTTHGLGSDGFLLAADTLVWKGDAVLGKPRSAAEAQEMLRMLSGQTHHVSTGVCVLYASTGAEKPLERAFVETSDVSFHELSEEQILAYVASGECDDKAGSYAIQGAGALLVKRIEGDYFNVVGLPLARVLREMSEMCENDTEVSLISTLLGRRHA